MANPKTYNSGNLIRRLGISRQALAQAKRKYPQWFIFAGKQGNAVLYQASGIEKWLKHRRALAQLHGRLK